MKIYLLLFCIILISCNSTQKSKENSIARVHSHETLKSDNYSRYLIIKGKHLKSVESKLKEYGELSSPDNQYTYKFSKAILADWIIIKFPNDFKDYYKFHNIIYWFLGFPPLDDNYAEEVIGLSVNNNMNTNYIIYNDYKLREKLSLEDDLFGVFENNEKFILSIPFDEFKETENSEISNYNEVFEKNNFSIVSIISKDLEFVEFEILFNEK